MSGSGEAQIASLSGVLRLSHAEEKEGKKKGRERKRKRGRNKKDG